MKCERAKKREQTIQTKQKSGPFFIIQFFVYFLSEHNSQWPITDPARIQTAAATTATTQDETIEAKTER
jgi:hypothetical protein